MSKFDEVRCTERVHGGDGGDFAEGYFDETEAERGDGGCPRENSFSDQACSGIHPFEADVVAIVRIVEAIVVKIDQFWAVGPSAMVDVVEEGFAECDA